MSLIWTPDPALPLIVSQEHETDLRAVITVTAQQPELPPKMLVWSMPDGRPDNMRIRTAENTLTLTIDNWIGLFPIEINYMEDADPVQIPGQVNQWKNLPAEQADVVAFIPDPQNVRNFRLIVEAYSSTNALLETATYTITVYANYDIGRDALKAAAQQRKDAT